MAVTPLNRDTEAAFVGRIESIDDHSTRQWGTMTPAQMFAHLNLGIKASLGEIEVKDRSNVVLRLLRPVLMSGVIPIVKGKAKTVPEYIADSAENAVDEGAALVETIGRFTAMCEESPDARPFHPLFGKMSIPEWQRGHGLHIDYHLRQFGG